MGNNLDDKRNKKDLLKDLIRRLHSGEAPDAVRDQLTRLLGKIPYDDVVKAEQELMSEGLPQEEIIKLCDVHTAVLEGKIDNSTAKIASPGHPVHTFQQENAALYKEIDFLESLYKEAGDGGKGDDLNSILNDIKAHFILLMDVDKHYRRKENLLFPFLEKHEITGPPKVMWAKHDEARELLKNALTKLSQAKDPGHSDFQDLIKTILKPASNSVAEMINKEEQILFPMSMDTLNDSEWYELYSQSIEIGYCLYDPVDEWKPDKLPSINDIDGIKMGRVRFSGGSLSTVELNSILNTLPVDLTFVDKNDTVRFFTRGKERIFDRNRSIIGRKVQLCHPPSSVDKVEKIINDFRNGNHDSAAFWINLGGRFIHIEYFAIRDDNGEYLGALEVSQDLTEKKKLEGEQRLISYS